MSENRKNPILLYLPLIAILIFLIVIIYSDYFYLPTVLWTPVPDAWISFTPLIIFLLIFIIIELRVKLMIAGS